MWFAALLLQLPQLASPSAASSAAPAPAPAVNTPAPQGDIVAFDPEGRRMTVQVRVGEHGPFPFVVDTGAERTVVSEELARNLGLPTGENVTLYSTSGATAVSTVQLPPLRFGRRRVDGIAAPTLRRVHLGAEGLIGVDSLQRAQVRFNFVRHELTILPAGGTPLRNEVSSGNTIIVTARSRVGRLIVTDARLDGVRVTVVIDTGAETSIGNIALRRQLESRGRLGPTRPVTVFDVTGGALAADYAGTNRLGLGGMTIDRLSVAFASSPVFERMGLERRPALLLGMDALRIFSTVAIDFAGRRVLFRQQAPEGDPVLHMTSTAADFTRPTAVALR